MNALDILKEAQKQIELKKYDFILINFANCDMVGHTGIFKSVVKAVETVDKCTGMAAETALENGYAVLITADHGNAEEMTDTKTNAVKTAHTLNLVEFIFLDENKLKLRPRGILSDIAPTVLEILNIEKPSEMTSKSLLKK
jgi:2,3-bisphosphoglycerate-independent phosphoglycerate mutase